jgi:hypothetical protein
VRARENSSPDISRPVEARKGGEGKGREDADAWGRRDRERKEGERARGRRAADGMSRAVVEQRRSMEAEEAADGPLCRGGKQGRPKREEGRRAGRSWMGRVERRGEREPARERERGRGGFGPAAGLFPFLLLFFFFSTLKLFKQFYLNSNKFEFKPYTPNTNETMLQHECTNKLIL